LAYPGALYAGPPLSKPRGYRIEAAANKLEGLRILIGTHSSLCDGNLTLELTSAKKPDHVLRKAAVEGRRLMDNEWVDLLFEPVLYSMGQEFLVTFKFIGASMKNNTAVPSIYEYALRNSYADRVRYKLQLINSYSLYGYTIHSV
jgi:hypothetical protein